MNKGKKLKEDIDKPVVEHLTELRERLLIVLLAMLAATVFFYFKTPLLIDILKKPIHHFKLVFGFFTITGAFTLRLKLALITSVVALSPLIYYQIMGFISPGLTDKERKLVYKSFFIVVPMFMAGAVFGYAIIVPKALDFLITYGSTYMSPLLSGEKYLSFIGLFCVLVGILTAIPIILIFMARLGILSSAFLKKIRKFIILTVLIGDGIIVGDLISFILIGLPFMIIYQTCILIVRYIEKRKNSNVTSKNSMRI